ncbi:ADP-ribosylglycohydrolase [Daldinia sp. FL1419]|nr:ADP-ribosylglycohydrolase [Daldinia sp. FL1419]
MHEQKEEVYKEVKDIISPLPKDYLERVYAGVLGKIIGVYMGRPFEGWTHQRILSELGHVRYYVNNKLGLPIVVTDDDISGTFTFIKALEEHYNPIHNRVQSQETHDGSEDNMDITEGQETPEASEAPGTPDTLASPESSQECPISAEQVGKTWLNNVIKNRTVFWWGGNGMSTEHTAFLNLRKGIKAPHSGSIQTNGRTIAEQIGAQIFIDGFAMAAPGNPALAVQLAGAAASVSHDGEALYAAQLWAAMEAEAFISKDVDHLLDTGLKFIPSDSLIATLIEDVRTWCEDDDDWMYTRQRIEKKYGYDKFPGICHVVPNHGIMIMSLIYAGNDFAEAMHVVNTCGWDTDCNSGNIGCLVAIMHGLTALDPKENGIGEVCDWRGPLADRVLISSADGGYSINNASNVAYDIVNAGRKLAGEDTLTPPKGGAQFHFSLPGSVQGFQYITEGSKSMSTIKKAIDNVKKSGLLIKFTYSGTPYVMTDTFTPPDLDLMHSYELSASPLIYPGQVLTASMRIKKYWKSVHLALRVYTSKDELENIIGTRANFTTDRSAVVQWKIPESLGCQPIQAVGITSSDNVDVWLEKLQWDGTPTLVLEPGDDRDGPRSFFKRSFVSSADMFDISFGAFVVSQDQGEGLVSYGTRDWSDYRAIFRNLVVKLGGTVGVAVRVRGLNRYYALLFQKGDINSSDSVKRIALVKALDEERIELASVEFDWQYDASYSVTLKVSGDLLYARVGKTELSARDSQYPGGGIGMLATDGCISIGGVKIGPMV